MVHEAEHFLARLSKREDVGSASIKKNQPEGDWAVQERNLSANASKKASNLH